MRLAIYVGTYHKYNCGSIEGEWIDIQDFVDKGDFYEYIRELHSDEDDPEFMFQEWEYIPRSLISESWVHEAVWEPRIQEVLLSEPEDLIGEWNKYQSEDMNGNHKIYHNNGEFFEEFFTKPLDAVSAVYFGNYNLSDDYVTFDGYDNLETHHNVDDIIHIGDLIEHLILNI
jgi:antirestriction protein